MNPSNDQQEYWGVVCEECKRFLPVFERDRTKLRKDREEEFNLKCPGCGIGSAYAPEEVIESHPLKRLKDFVPVKGFRNE